MPGRIIPTFSLLKKGVACTLDAKICPDGTAVGRIPPDCQFAPCPAAKATFEPSLEPEETESPSDWQETFKENFLKESNSKRYLYLVKKMTEDSESTVVDIVALLPDSAEVTDVTLGTFGLESVEVQIGDSIYSVGGFEYYWGLCPEEDFGSSCNYKDEKFKNIETLRLWYNSEGFFAINPQSISVNGHFINHFTVHKLQPNKIFTQEEISQWKIILATIQKVD